MSASNTLLNTINVVSTFINTAPLTDVGNFHDQPALLIGDWIRQFILSPPFAWRWNRKTTLFSTIAGVQDYLLTSWTSLTKLPLGTNIIDTNGNVQIVTTAGTTGTTQPTWNVSLNGTTNDSNGGGTVVWTNRGSAGTSTSLLLSDFGWLERAGLGDQAGTFIHELQVSLDLGEELTKDRPIRISAFLDDDSGHITFRLLPVPDVIYNVKLHYQAAAPVFTSSTDSWSPIPDFFSYLYNQGFLAKAYEFNNDDRFPISMQMFVRQVIAANAGLSESQVNIFLSDRLNTMRQSESTMGTTKSGLQGRGMF